MIELESQPVVWGRVIWFRFTGREEWQILTDLRSG